MPKVTVVVPIYNVKSYLNKCIDSICTQTLEDIEIILIDDGSTDGSGYICVRYSEYDSRIRVIHKENGGLSSARNIGIDVAISQYIMFVDGDDWVEPDFCELPYKSAIEYDSELVLFKHFSHKKDFIESSKIAIPEGIVSERQALYFNLFVSVTAWSGMYKRTLFNRIHFPVGKYWEDVATTYRLIHEAQIITLIDKCLYHYIFNRPGSITTSKETRNHHDRQEMHIKRIIDLIDWGYEEYAILDTFKWLVYGEFDDEGRQDLLMIVSSSNVIPESFNWKQRIMIMILRKSPALFDKICVIMNKRNNES